MDWTNLLKSTIRLADTYDLARTPGGESVQVGTEDRRKNSNGLWFSLATQLLEYLHVKDLTQPMAYHSIEPFFESLDSSFAAFKIEDVKYLVNLLAKEFELKFHNQDISILKNSTPLIEKKQNGFRCKLSPTGISSVSLSYTAEELLYGDQIALQIKKALTLGDFDNFVQYADKLINSIMHQSHELMNLLEISGRKELREHYKRKGDAYMDTLEKILNITGDIGTQLRDPKTGDHLDEFIASNPDKAHYHQFLFIKLEQVHTNLLGFRKNLSKFLKMFYLLQENVLPTVDFHQLSLSIAREEIPETSQENLMSLYGFWFPSNLIASPAHDIWEKSSIPHKTEHGRPMFNEGKGTLIKSLLQQYVEENVDTIMGSIEEDGYFSLHKAFTDESGLIENLEDLTSIVGLCLTSSEIKKMQKDLVVCVQNSTTKTSEIENLSVRYHDLILTPMGQ